MVEEHFHEDMKPDIKKPGLVATGLMFSIVSVLLVTIGAWAQNREFYSGILLTEFVVILIPPILLLIFKKHDIRKVLRLNPISLLNLFIIFSMMLFSLWIVNVLNIFNLWMIKHIFGQIFLPEIPIAENSSQILINVFVIGGAAGICEEVMFRGVIQRSMERFGAFLSILIAGLLFGLFHMDFQRLLGTFLLGVLIGYIVYRTNSLFAGMFAHFANNSLAVVISSLAGKLTQSGIPGTQAGDVDINEYFTTLESMPPFQLAVVIMVWAGIILFCGAALGGLMYAFIRNTAQNRVKVEPSGNKRILPAILAFLPGLAVIALYYVLIGKVLVGGGVEFISGLW